MVRLCSGRVEPRRCDAAVVEDCLGVEAVGESFVGLPLSVVIVLETVVLSRLPLAVVLCRRPVPGDVVICASVPVD